MVGCVSARSDQSDWLPQKSSLLALINGLSSRFVIKPQRCCHVDDMLVTCPTRSPPGASIPQPREETQRFPPQIAPSLANGLRGQCLSRVTSRSKTRKAGPLARAGLPWRRGWDLNPRTPEGQCLSRASHSAALAPLLGEWSIARYRRSRNGGRADECTRLESGRTERFRGFESPPFRQDRAR